jgi:hypothetical protein
MMANQIIFPSTNPYPRNAFSCGQSKQAVSMFHTNYQNRMDKSSILLNCGQNPLVRSRYFEPITKNQHPYGINAIVAIACYTGYNVEDSILMNKSALDRGIFRTTYFNVYESTEETTKVGNLEVQSTFMDINNNDVIGLKPGYDYSHLNADSGLIKENALVDDKTILIGKAVNSLTSSDAYVDESIGPKKGQMGYVDKSFMTEGETGNRLAKVRLRNDRIPGIGDKFCSRAGQKGTIGLVLEEKDMPFTEDGLRPDIIINPHAIPSRMTIGHLVEVLIGKSCALMGGLGDCTAFANKGPKEKEFGEILVKNGYSSTGNELLYNGMTGEQLETEIYFGPTYYLRLKHMVKDKINYRARGPRTALTRQTVQGRANDGGLRIGEMDRDAILCHGMAHFMYESMMERGDKYYMAVCNNTGTIAVYNESKDIFLSPMSDGPLQFSENLDGTLNIVPISKYGKTFSIVKVPYAFKLLYQELQAMNIQMRIITEDNIDQLTNAGDMTNVVKLTGLSSLEQVSQANKENLSGNTLHREVESDRKVIMKEEPKLESKFDEGLDDDDEFDPTSFDPIVPPSPLVIGDKVRMNDDLQKDTWTITGVDGFDIIAKNSKGEVKITTFNNIEKVDDGNQAIFAPTTPDSSPKSPDYDPTTGVLYAPTSPAYMHTSPQYVPTSPQYVPTSPQYVPTTPPYGPTTPPYVPTTPPYVPTTPPQVPTSPQYDPTTGVNYVPPLELPPQTIQQENNDEEGTDISEKGEGTNTNDDEVDKEEEMNKITREIIEPVFDKDLEMLKTNNENEDNSGDEGDNTKHIG